MSRKQEIIKRTRKEEIEFRKLQKAISQLPEPSFNNPEKVQPVSQVVVPTVIQGVLQEKLNFSEDEKDKIIDKSVILDTKGIRLEKIAKVKKAKKRFILKRFWPYLKPNLGLLIAAIIFALIYSAFELLIPLFIGRGVDCILGTGNVDFDGIAKYAVLIGVSIIGFATFRWLAGYMENSLSYRIEQQLHIDIFKKFNKVPLKILDGASVGDLQSRMVNDVDNITDGFVLGLTSIFDCFATISMTIVLLFITNPIIGGVIVAITPISAIVAFIIAKRAHKLFKREAKNLGDLSGTLVEMLGNQKIVTAFQYEERSIQKFDEINKRLQDSSAKSVFYSTLTAPTSRFINGILYAVVAILGCIFACNGMLSVGKISMLLSYANKYTKPFNELADVFSDLQSALASASRVFNVLDIENESSDIGLAVIKSNNGKVVLKNVDFSYTQSKKLIQNFNLNVDKGQKVAIVGPTGCGKSTLINLLMRFYDVNSGEIWISDHKITDITRKSLRNQFGMVLQETWLFSASIRDNIAYGKPNASDAEVKKAARLAGADYFIQTLPNGYNTIINENGDNLSQGQKQLICIARLMLTTPPMMILDEATSNIDTRTELAIQKAFDTIMKGKTSFIVAHRLSTITSADIILVMNKGNVIEQGTHSELLAKKGFYYNLYNSQFSKY